MRCQNHTCQQFIILGLWSRLIYKSLHSHTREQKLKEKLTEDGAGVGGEVGRQPVRWWWMLAGLGPPSCWPGPGNRWSSSLRETSRVSPSPNSPGPFTLDQLVSPSWSNSELQQWGKEWGQGEMEAGKGGLCSGPSQALGAILFSSLAPQSLTISSSVLCPSSVPCLSSALSFQAWTKPQPLLASLQASLQSELSKPLSLSHHPWFWDRIQI